MKVLLINGSPHKNGCTFTALEEIQKELFKQEVDSEIFHIGTKPIRGCIACRKCFQSGVCIFKDDSVNQAIELLKESDGVIVGSPVHYASAAGAVTAFLDRLFYGKSEAYAYKPAAAIVSCRRGGASATFDQLNKYFAISSMPIVTSQYWNSVHGNTPEEVKQDLEGLQTMRLLADNMAWMLKCIKAGEASGLSYPEREPKLSTNFIR
jgi:multimeric flavodoxin WrbA